jgi:hypothetical protein
MKYSTASYLGYIEQLNGDGWLKVKFDDGLVWPLPEYLKVYVTRSEEREAFKILEGKFKGKTATVKKKGFILTDWDSSYFEKEGSTKPGFPHKNSAEIYFYRKAQKLAIAGLGEFNAETWPSNPMPLGTHEVELPYEPHDLGMRYSMEAKYAKTWFRAGHAGDRFLHCGRISAGCITVTDIGQWDKIYKHLILSRRGFDNVGTIKVIE